MTDVIQINRLLEAAPFSSHLLVGTLEPETVSGITNRFDALEPLIKIRLLLACLYIPNNAQDMRAKLSKLIAKASRERESEWVRQVASLVSCWLELDPSESGQRSTVSSQREIDALVSQCLAAPAGATLRNPDFWAIDSCYLARDLVPDQATYTYKAEKSPFGVQESFKKVAAERQRKAKERREAAAKMTSRPRTGSGGGGSSFSSAAPAASAATTSASSRYNRGHASMKKPLKGPTHHRNRVPVSKKGSGGGGVGRTGRGIVEFDMKELAKSKKSKNKKLGGRKRPRNLGGLSAEAPKRSRTLIQPRSRPQSAVSSPTRGAHGGQSRNSGKVGAAEARIAAARAKLLKMMPESSTDAPNFSGLGDNVLKAADRAEIIRFKTDPQSVPAASKPPLRKIVLHKCWQVNDAGQKIARVHIVMRLDYTEKTWKLVLLKKNSAQK